MTTDAQIRLAALELAFAAGDLTQAELRELEALRDEAGQGWLLDPGAQERAGEPGPGNRANHLAEGLARRLVARDEGEQADLFGQGLLL